MRVRYTARAFAERERIFAYLDARNPQAARSVVGLIKQRIEELGDAPYKGHRTDRGGIFTLWITPYPYRIYYRIDGEDVVIIHIRHTSRRPWGPSRRGP
jgi:addiction module RelE/StbE family toxin